MYNPKDLVSLLQPLDELSEDDFRQELAEWLIYRLGDIEERVVVEELIPVLVDDGREDLMVIFVETMSNNNPVQELVPYVCKLLGYELSETVVQSLFQSISDMDYYPLMDGLTEMSDEDAAYRAMSNIHSIFKDEAEPDLKEVEQVLAKAQQRNNNVMVQYLEAYVAGHTEEYHKVPEWIITTDPLPTHADLVKGLKIPEPKHWHCENIPASLRKDANYLAWLDRDDVELNPNGTGTEYEQVIYEGMARLSVTEREEHMNWLIKNNTYLTMEFDQEIFRVMGACLPQGEAFTQERKSDDPCAMYAGCRVMTCYENENWNVDLDREIIEDAVEEGRVNEIKWFTGQCRYCNKLIAQKHYALRMPIESGGWLGCFGSFECIRKTVPDNEIRQTLIDQAEAQYANYGIYERTY